MSEALILELAKKIQTTGFAVPAVVLLESMLPLHNVMFNLGTAVEPMINSVLGFQLDKYLPVLESRENYERLLQLIEQESKSAGGKKSC